MRRTVGNSRVWRAVDLVGGLVLIFAASYNAVYAIYPFFHGDDFNRAFALTMLFIFVGTVVSHWIFRLLGEVSRLLCIPVAGWRFVSFRFGQGRGVRCLLDPPAPVNGECPCVCYLLCGGLSNLLLGILLIGIGFFAPIGAFLRFFGFLALRYAWRCFVPRCYGGTGNDGYWLLRLGENPKRSAVIGLLRKLAVEMERAETYGDFSEETVKALAEYECGDFRCGDEVIPLYYRAHYLLAQGDREGAAAVYRVIAESAAPDETRRRAYCELLYAAILDGATEEELSVLYQRATGDENRVKRDSTSRRRFLYAVRLLYEKDKARAEEEYQALLRLCKTEPFRAQAALDLREAKRVRELYGNGSGTEVVS